MLPKEVVQLLQEIYANIRNEEVLQVLRQNPTELLTSLLTQIKDDLPVVSATLANTVESGAFGLIPSVKEMKAEYAAKKERSKK